MNLTQEMKNYLAESQEELKQLIRDMCVIPAPSHHEERRAAFCKAWFEKNGFENVYIDEALNVICPYNMTDDCDVLVFMAHTDIVFPESTPLILREDEEKMYCPGITDDTSNLAVMMICARYIIQHALKPDCGVLFVANSCEEGLGNLKGSAQIVKDFGSRMRALVSFDGLTMNRVCCDAVGSHRYRVEIKTEGGHSFSKFGNRNAIHYLASMIDTLYTIKVPQNGDSKTTYNVGMISGGTSVNTIAQQAEMLYEYRSTDRDCLAKMQNFFEKTVEAYRAMGIEVNVEMVGNRPCKGEMDEEKHAALIAMADATIRDIIGEEPVHTAGSTDCNIPLSLGIPSICLTAASGAFAHTTEEEVDKKGLVLGSKLTLDFMMNFFKA